VEAFENAYSMGPFAPVSQEITVDGLEVKGELPKDLSGTFVRNGPNPKFTPKGRYHWFDGDGMVHGVQIQNGKVTYRNRYVRTQGLELEEKNNRSLWKGILEPLQFDNPHGILKNTSNTDLVWWNNKLLSLWWMGKNPYELKLPSLDTLGQFDFDKKHVGGFSAHPKIDPETGEMMFIDFNVMPRPPYLTYNTVNPGTHEVKSTIIEVPGPRLFHDIAITKKYTILMDHPMFYDFKAISEGKFKIKFDRSLPSRFGVIPRYGDNSQIKWFEASPCYIYHAINAYEEGNEVVLIACKIEEPVLNKEMKNCVDTPHPHLHFLQLLPQLYIWRFNLESGAVKEKKLDDTYTEFPRMNDSKAGQKAQFSYNPRIAKGTELLFDGLIKYDLVNGTSQTFEFGKHRFGGEAVFAPKPGAVAEDAGWVMTFVYDCRNDSTEFIVLNAEDFLAGPVASVQLPQRVPIGFHACWVPQ